MLMANASHFQGLEMQVNVAKRSVCSKQTGEMRMAKTKQRSADKALAIAAGLRAKKTMEALFASMGNDQSEKA